MGVPSPRAGRLLARILASAGNRPVYSLKFSDNHRVCLLLSKLCWLPGMAPADPQVAGEGGAHSRPAPRIAGILATKCLL